MWHEKEIEKEKEKKKWVIKNILEFYFLHFQYHKKDLNETILTTH